MSVQYSTIDMFKYRPVKLLSMNYHMYSTLIGWILERMSSVSLWVSARCMFQNIDQNISMQKSDLSASLEFNWRDTSDTLMVSDVDPICLEKHHAHKQRAQATHGCLCILGWPYFRDDSTRKKLSVCPYISMFLFCPTSWSKLVIW